MATAIAHPNIALVKYWGKRDPELNLPATGSLSLTLAPYATETSVQSEAPQDEAWINGTAITGPAAQRIFKHLDLLDPWRKPATVTSETNFPMAAGLASSASAFAALTLAGCAAFGQDRNPVELSILARQGSGSACRSLFGGWVEWACGTRGDGLDSHAHELAPEDHWDLRMVVATFHDGPKPVGSTEGMMRTMATSPFYPGWIASVPEDLHAARNAILSRDLEALGTVMERSALRMHASMLGADPPIRYWKSSSIWGMDAVENLRANGVGAWWTMDAGPNLKILCEAAHAKTVKERMQALADRVEVLAPGGAARLLEDT
jgi:diphosphomevalonate decarboxylase